MCIALKYQNQYMEVHKIHLYQQNGYHHDRIMRMFNVSRQQTMKFILSCYLSIPGINLFCTIYLLLTFHQSINLTHLFLGTRRNRIWKILVFDFKWFLWSTNHFLYLPSKFHLCLIGINGNRMIQHLPECQFCIKTISNVV